MSVERIAKSTPPVFVGVLLFGLAISLPAFAQDSATNASKAANASATGGGALAASGVEVATAASVVPASGAAVGLGLVASAATAGGKMAGATAVGMSQAAGDSAVAANGPLPVAKQVIVAPQPKPNVPYDTKPKP